MATSNTKFKVENGLDVVGTANVSGTLRVDGDLSVGGNLAVALTVAGDIKPTANHSYNLGNTTFRWSVLGSSGDFSNNLAVTGDTTLNNAAVANLVPSQNNQPLGSSVRRWALVANTINTLTANVTTALTISPSSVSFNALSGVNGTTEVITTDSNHGFANGDFVQYVVAAGNTAVSGLSNGSYYYVVGANATTGLQLASSYGGAALNLTAGINQTGHTLVLAELFANASQITAPLSTVLVGPLRTTNNLTVDGSATISGISSFVGNVAFDTDLLFLDAVNNRVGIKNTSPSASDLLTISGNTVVTGLNAAVRFLSTNATHNGSVMVAGNTTNTRLTLTTYETNATASDGGFAFNAANATTTTSVLAFNQLNFQYKSGNVAHAGNFGIFDSSGTRLGP